MNDRKVIYLDDAIDAIYKCTDIYVGNLPIMIDKADAYKALDALPPAQKKGYTKTDYIMALHKEYRCSLARAEEAHRKALEYLRNTSIMKG